MCGCVDLCVDVCMDGWITGTSMQPRHGTARYGIYTILGWAGLGTHSHTESRTSYPGVSDKSSPNPRIRYPTLSDKIYPNHRTTYPSETKLIPRVTANPRAIFTYTQGYSHWYSYLIIHGVTDIVFLEFWIVVSVLFDCLGGCVYAGVFVLFSVLFVWVVGVFRLGGWGGHAKLLFWKAARAICVLQIARTRA